MTQGRRFPTPDGDQFLPAPWVVIGAERAAWLVEELRLEVAEGHSLASHRLEVVAQCAGCDSVLGRLDDGRWFVCHLTWTNSKPDRPPWPWATIVDSLDELLAEFDDHTH